MPWSRRVELYLYYSYVPYGLCRASVPVQGCTLPYFYLFVHTTKYKVFSRTKNKKLTQCRVRSGLCGMAKKEYYRLTNVGLRKINESYSSEDGDSKRVYVPERSEREDVPPKSW